MSGLQSTYSVNAVRADFHRADFETLIKQKGREVILEKALLCPCKSKSTNQQSNCKNCGGTGWLFINPVQTRLVLQGMTVTPDYKAWSEEITGDLKVTASDTEELSYMDRITVLDGKAIYNEVLFIKNKGSVNFSYSAYNIKQILYAGLFKGTGLALQRLVEDIDYTFERNIFKIINPALLTPIQGDVSVTLRYVHAPTYHIIDMKRESMESFELTGGSEKLIHLPISGTARRAHYQKLAYNLTSDNIINNSYQSSITSHVEIPKVKVPVAGLSTITYSANTPAIETDLSKLIILNGSNNALNYSINPANYVDKQFNVYCESNAHTVQILVTSGVIKLKSGIDQSSLEVTAREFIMLYSNGIDLIVL